MTVAQLRTSWLASLAGAGPLPERTVIVRNEATAHAWRRDVVTAGRADLLVGTRFVTPLAVVTEILHTAGVTFALGEESTRPARTAALFTEAPALRAFDLEILRTRPGWDRAFASTIGDLEAAGQTPQTLRGSGDPRCHDVAEIWERLDLRAGTSWTSARALIEAARLLTEAPARWPFDGACLTEVTGHETPALAGWLAAIPRLTRTRIALRPRRTSHEERVRLLFGELPAQILADDVTTEHDLLAAYLFAPPEAIADRARPRSRGIDDTVHFEEHAGVEEELDAAVAWVIGEVAERGTPLEQLAIVVPRLDPYASLLAHRFQALGADGVHVLGGLPATHGAGARIATLIEALQGYLHIDAMADLLPILELATKELHVSRRDAIALLYELGTAGGDPAHREGALEWAARRAHREAAIAEELAAASTNNDAERKAWTLQRNLERLAALGPALAALDHTAQVLVRGGSLVELWSSLRELCAHHVRLGGEGKRILAAIDAELAPLIAANVLAGDRALDAIGDLLGAMRVPAGRFGEPRVTVVSLADAAGLSFQAIRIVGLSEGNVPTSVREDPVLPDAARATLGARVATSADRTTRQLHALFRVVCACERIVLSTSRMDPAGGYREPSGIMIEAAAALGRPPLGEHDAYIPDAHVMRRIAWAPGRAHLHRLRDRWPVDARALLTRASHRREVAAAWITDALRPLAHAHPGPGPDVADGWFPAGPFPELPGLSPDKPISASALGQLLECPHRFLYERILGWRAPPELTEEGTIDALSYGSLFHETAEHFYRAHGAAFCARSQPLDAWQAIARDLADRRFHRFLESYPLVGADVRTAQRGRLQRDLRALLDADWATAKTFVDVERSFGPMPLEVGGETVHVHGYIDRLDTIGTTTLVRDLKTGKAKPRESAEDLRPAYDVQLGLYGLVTRANARSWDVPATVVGAYVYPADAGDERGFIDDFPALAAATGRWITTAADLLRRRRFPRTPVETDCTFCAFKPVCGAKAQERAATLLDGDDVRAFAVMKLGEEEP